MAEFHSVSFAPRRINRQHATWQTHSVELDHEMVIDSRSVRYFMCLLHVACTPNGNDLNGQLSSLYFCIIVICPLGHICRRRSGKPPECRRFLQNIMSGQRKRNKRIFPTFYILWNCAAFTPGINSFYMGNIISLFICLCLWLPI